MEEVQKNERVTVEEAAKVLGLSINGVREHMKRGLFNPPIGYVTNPNGKYNYLIYRNMLNRYIGGVTGV